MNKIIKIILSVVIASLIALIVPIEGQGKNIENKPVVVECIAINVDRYAEEQSASINIEIDKAIEEMNQKMAEIESIDNKKQWFLAYRNIIEDYSYILDPPETIYDCFTEEEFDLLFHVVQAEIGDGYSFEQKTNVASVIFNRIEHERFPDTLGEILVADQFATISNGRYRKVEVSENTILACEYAYQIKDTTDGCLFFDSNNKLKYEFVFSDGAHNFYTLKEDKKGKR